MDALSSRVEDYMTFVTTAHEHLREGPHSTVKENRQMMTEEAVNREEEGVPRIIIDYKTMLCDKGV
jgi:hypothetical protein